jgi:hypothetical protein
MEAGHLFGQDTSFQRAAMEIRRLPPTEAEESTGCVVAADGDWHRVCDGVPMGNGTRLYLGYDDGFVVAANQGSGSSNESADYLMRINSWTQLRHTFFDSDGPNLDQNSFSFERLRLAFAGHVYSPDLEYFTQLDGGSDRATEAIFLDYFLTYDFGRGVLGCEEDQLAVRLGKWKVPFSRSREESGRRLQFTDRASANVFFDLNRSIGVGLNSQLGFVEQCPLFVSPIHIETAIFNGFKTGSVRTSRGSEELDRNFGWSLRSYVDLFSEFGSDGEPDLSWHSEPTLRMGGGLAYTRVDIEGSFEFSRQRGVDSGEQLSAILPATASAYDVGFATVDAHFKCGGLAIISEYYWRYITNVRGGEVPSLYDDGFVLQVGYFVVPERFELLSRWSRIAGKSGTLGLTRQSSDEFGAGFAWYLKGHNAKLVFDATRHNGVPLSSNRLDVLPGDAGWLYRTQFQLAF